MTRAPVTSEVQRAVLTKSRRRCCFCFGLHRDVELKKGQIAHIDHDSSKSTEDNLAYMCFEHHDEYDSKTRQAKGLRPEEAIHYRDELYMAMDKAMSGPVAIGKAPTSGLDIAGHYVGGSPEAGADVSVVVIGSNRIRVLGHAYWGASHPNGPNIGILELDGSSISPSLFELTDVLSSGTVVRFRLEFVHDGLLISEENSLGYFGINVTFRGTYRKEGDARLPKGLLNR